MFQRGVRRGEVLRDADHEAIFAAVAGAMYFRVLVMGQPVDERWINRVVDAFELG